jgi:phospholipid/cholesterol/gamma-HCH transport system ATP-binding protein
MDNAMDQEHTPAIEIEDLHKSFGSQTVLDGVDLKIECGETLAVLGPSGTGKSVLLKLIIGLQKADAGSIKVNGKEITQLPLEKLNQMRKEIGFLFQSAALYDSLSVEENVAFPLRQHAKLSDTERTERIHELLTAVGIEQGFEKLPSQLSGGMKKRVGLARALALAPKILLYDEPTAGLDPVSSSRINELILRLQRERKISSIVVTHDVHSARTVSDRLAFLYEGSIKAEGSAEELEKSENELISQFFQPGH